MRQPAKTIEQVEQEIAEEKQDKRTLTKELVIQRNPNGLYYIAFTSGGEVPDTLKGMWTSIVKATAAIENHKVMAAQSK